MDAEDLAIHAAGQGKLVESILKQLLGTKQGSQRLTDLWIPSPETSPAAWQWLKDVWQLDGGMVWHPNRSVILSVVLPLFLQVLGRASCRAYGTPRPHVS